MDPRCVESMSLHCTDALPHCAIKCIENTRALSKNGLERVERDLEEYEKVSILFLIAADDPCMRRKVLEICKNIGEKASVITELVQSDLDGWSEKLLEALCLINNREVLRNLGFSPAETVQKYLRNVSRYTRKIHPVSKVLYNLFETMDANRRNLLLRYVYEEEGVERLLDSKDYLELHALQWLRAKYITISDRRGDLSKLFKHLKKMGYCAEAIYHDVEHFSIESGQSDSGSTGKSLADLHSVITNEDVPAETRLQESQKRRVIQKGKCIIINEENFSQNVETKYGRREGTKKDAENLRRTFIGLGFDVEELEDLTNDEIFKELQRISKNFDKKIHDCLVVVILSHGYEGGIISADGKEVSIKDVDDAMCTWHLRDVVKILIVQACQGKIIGNLSQNPVLALDGPVGQSDTKGILRHRNFAKFMSTMNGFSAIRHKEQGSWFILDVCDVLSEGESLSVMQWQMRVIEKTWSKFGHVNGCHTASQIPEFTARLGVEVIFPRYEEKRVVASEKALR